MWLHNRLWQRSSLTVCMDLAGAAPGWTGETPPAPDTGIFLDLQSSRAGGQIRPARAAVPLLPSSVAMPGSMSGSRTHAGWSFPFAGGAGAPAS